MFKNIIKYPLVCFLICLIFVCCSSSYEVIIRDGTVLDGTGRDGFRADIGISDGIILKIGKLGTLRGKLVIEAQEMFVAPGFIDMHTHSDNIRDEKRMNALNYLTQGVTTMITGNCGGGTYDVDEFFRILEKQGAGTNIVHLVGHGTVRSAVMQNEDREPTDEEMQKMKSLVEKAMQEGAAGLSSGLFYAPGSYSKTEEVIELCQVVEKYGGFYATHIRDESNYSIGLLAAIEEAVEIGEKAGVPVQISHIKALGKPVWGQAQEVCQVIEAAQKRGVIIYADQYPYIASSTSLAAATIPRWVQAGRKMRERLKDPLLIPGIKKEIADNIERRGGAETLMISSFPKKSEWEGKSLKDISAILKRSVVDTAVEIVLMGSAGVVSFNMSDEDVEYFMKRPWIMTGSDGSIMMLGQAMPHPRNYGTFPRKIRSYVLEKKIISMEQAIRAASGLPAKILGFEDRGLLKEGYVADVVVFDPSKIRDRATFANPHQYSEGIEYLLIRGKTVVEGGEFTGTLAGVPLRGKKRN